jgi:mannose-1-phosphate guanylyltransferase
MRSDAYWIDTGTPEAYIGAQLDLVDGSRGGLPAIHPSALVDPRADVRRSVVMAGATVGPGARLCDAVVMDGGSVGAGAVVDHSVVGPGALVGSGASVTELTVLGAGVVVGVGQLLRGARVPEDF